MNQPDVTHHDKDLLLFEEQNPNATLYWPDLDLRPFESACPPDKKIKVENLFQFKRKRGDLLFSCFMFALAMFFLFFFWTETGWDKRKLPDNMLDYLLFQFGVLDIEGRVTRFGRILKQPWVAPLLCLLVFVPAAVANLWGSRFVHQWRKRFLLPTAPTYELEQWFRALEFVAYFIGYTMVVPILGYLVSTVLFGLFLTWRLGYRTKRWMGISLTASLTIVIVFRSFLQIKTPINIWLYDQLPPTAKSFLLSYF